jgi:hypothetical protein
MPRSTQSRGVRRGRKTEPEVVEPTFDERMTDEEREEFAGMLAPAPIVDEVQDPQVEQALDAADELTCESQEIELRETEVPALHARDFDWATMKWVPPKTNGSRPCLCNRLRGHECDLSTKSRFAIGHDARFKGVLQTAFRSGAKLPWTFETGDILTTEDGTGTKLEEPREELLDADQIARLVAPKLLPHVTHQSRGAKLQKLDAEAGTSVPQTAVDSPKADEELTDADLEGITDDAEGADAGH